MNTNFRLVIALCLSWLSIVCIAQSIDTPIVFNNIESPLTSAERQMIQDAYGDNADRIFFDNPTMENNAKDILRNRVKVQHMTKRDWDKFNKEMLSAVDIHTIEIRDNSKYNKLPQKYSKDTFNPFLLNWNLYPIKAQVYKYGEYIIYIYPQKRKKK